MANFKCNIDTVTGRLLGLENANPDVDALVALGHEGTNAFLDQKEINMLGVSRHYDLSDAGVQALLATLKDSQNKPFSLFKSLNWAMKEYLLPSQIKPLKPLVANVEAYIDNFLAQHGMAYAELKKKNFELGTDNPESSSVKGAFSQLHNQYLEGLRPLLKEFDDDIAAMPPEMAIIANDYVKYEGEGGLLFSGSTKQGKLEGALKKSMAAKLYASGTIFFGNFFESVKLPVTYGHTASLKGISKLLEVTKNKPWAQIPELAKKQVYAENALGLASMEANLSITDNLLRNLSYFTAEAAGKDGLEGVERVAFVVRPGNVPAYRRTSSGRLAHSLLNYTIGTYRWFYSTMLDSSVSPVERAAFLARYMLFFGALGAGTSGGVAALEGKSPEEIQRAALAGAAKGTISFEAQLLGDLALGAFGAPQISGLLKDDIGAGNMFRLGGIRSVSGEVGIFNDRLKKVEFALKKASDPELDAGMKGAYILDGVSQTASLFLPAHISNDFVMNLLRDGLSVVEERKTPDEALRGAIKRTVPVTPEIDKLILGPE